MWLIECVRAFAASLIPVQVEEAFKSDAIREQALRVQRRNDALTVTEGDWKRWAESQERFIQERRPGSQQN